MADRLGERSGDRVPSISSSVTEADAYNEKNQVRDSSEGESYALKTPEEMEIGEDIEREGLLRDGEEEKTTAAAPPASTTRSAIIWMVVNTLATIGIVSCIATGERLLSAFANYISRSSQTRPSSTTNLSSLHN